jgi:tetratricopeptide (TPR) repeat protein
VLIRKYMTCTMIAGAIAATTFLSGCTTTPDAAVAQSTEAFNKSLAEADAAAAAATGDKSAAIRQYQKIATDNPTRGEPWSRIAQIYFNEGRYSLAISAAEETLRRDPASRQAKSITAVGGLRLAARSIEDLGKDSTLSGDANADAYRLAALLRETLGLSVLVPGGADAKTTPARRPVASNPSPAPSPSTSSASQPTPVAAVRPAPAPAPRPAPAPAPRAGGSANPFDALK